MAEKVAHFALVCVISIEKEGYTTAETSPLVITDEYII